MQSNNITIAPGQALVMQCPGTGIWFESGNSTTANCYIVVKPDTGTECTLRPGQHVQDPKNSVRTWNITALDPTATITGRVIIGNGDFGDANTSNVVTATNTSSTPLFVQQVTGLSIPISSLAYSLSFMTATGGAAAPIVTPAQNVNGAIVQAFSICQQAATTPSGYTLVANAGTAAPGATPQMGQDWLFQSVLSGVGAAYMPYQIKVPAGKGIYLFQAGGTGVYFTASGLVTLL